MSDDAPPKKPAAGIPAWVMTFADLMSLLMCFFVLLLSFSEMDVQKYKQVAGSMSEAFGVQREVKTKDIPKGTSVIAKEFSPGRPQPTPLNVVRQNTMNDMHRNLDMSQDPLEDPNADTRKQQKNKSESQQAMSVLKAMEKESERKKMQQQMKNIREALSKQIAEKALDVEADGLDIIIRIREHASFEPGSADLKPAFRTVLMDIGDILNDSTGPIVVVGHSDNQPIHTVRFRSNWELSASRAATVVQEIISLAPVPAKRFRVEGRADTKPLAPNNTRKNRSINRRVEIIMKQGRYDTKEHLVKVHEGNESKNTQSEGQSEWDFSRRGKGASGAGLPADIFR